MNALLFLFLLVFLVIDFEGVVVSRPFRKPGGGEDEIKAESKRERLFSFVASVFSSTPNSRNLFSTLLFAAFSVFIFFFFRFIVCV